MLPGSSLTRLQRSARPARFVTSMAGHGKFFVGGNWKCNGTLESVKKLVTDLNSADIPPESDLEVVVSPTFIHLDYVKNNIKPRYQVAAQNCWVGKGGAFTVAASWCSGACCAGEISAEQLHDMGIPWVIVGHSERRSLLEECNDFVGHKAAYALSQDIGVIACIGETLSQRESGNMFDVLGAQLASIADNIADWHNVVVAYEPVWAIGTGKVATPEQAQEVHAFIRKWFNDKVGSEVANELRIIYGGSVNDQNAGEIARKQDVDGFLVGGASLKGKTFAKICQAQTKAYA